MFTTCLMAIEVHCNACCPCYPQSLQPWCEVMPCFLPACLLRRSGRVFPIASRLCCFACCTQLPLAGGVYPIWDFQVVPVRPFLHAFPDMLAGF
jgi:hypothetical protein